MVLGIIIVHAVGFDSPTLTDVQPGFSAEEQGMQAGDVITKLNHEPVVVYRDITIYMMLHPSDPVDVEFKRLAADGVTWEKHTVTLTPGIPMKMADICWESWSVAVIQKPRGSARL